MKTVTELNLTCICSVWTTSGPFSVAIAHTFGISRINVGVLSFSRNAFLINELVWSIGNSFARFMSVLGALFIKEITQIFK
jgi:hypothetical protein